VAQVSCYRAGGVRDRSAFSLIFSSSSGGLAGPSRFGYVDVRPSGAIVSQYNSVGLVNSATHGVKGVWVVKFPGLTTPGPRAGGLQATAVNPQMGARCKVNNWASGASGQLVRVTCFDPAGAPLDTRFTLTFQYRRSLYGAALPPKSFGYVWNQPPQGPSLTNFNSVLGPGANTVVPGNSSLNVVTFKNIGVAPDDVQVTAFGGGSGFCGLNIAWKRIGTAAVVRDVNCFTTTGTPAVAGFFVSYNSRV
jgi:hypothetical protein